MKKYIPWIIIALVVFWIFSSYNGLVNKQENTEAAWAQVENVYQRRADLVPNLVNTVKGAAEFERGTLNDVIEARAKASSITVDPSNLSPEAIQRFEQAQEGLSSALSRLMVVVERYPQLRATENFSQLQAQLEGTENRISVERRRFNNAVRTYNTAIRRFPGNVMAGIFGFDRAGYFEADEGADTAPEVQF